MAVTDTWADWSSTAASNSPAGGASPEIDDELRNIKAQVKGNIIAATQAVQETGTSTTAFVVTGVQKYHPSAAKFWVNFAINGTVNASYNVTDITDTGTGFWKVNIATDFSTANYCCVASPFTINKPAWHLVYALETGVVWLAMTNGTDWVDPSIGMFAAGFGDQ